MDRITMSSSHRSGGRFAKYLLQFALALSLGLAMGTRAVAQYGGGGGTGGTGGTGGGGGYSGGGYGSSGKAVGIGVGAAAGGAGLLFLALHGHGRMTGCVQNADDGLRIVDEKKNQSYTLVPGDVLVKAGQRVELKGQKSKSGSGAETFEAKKLIKDLGACGGAPSAPASGGNPASQ